MEPVTVNELEAERIPTQGREYTMMNQEGNMEDIVKSGDNTIHKGVLGELKEARHFTCQCATLPTT